MQFEPRPHFIGPTALLYSPGLFTIWEKKKKDQFITLNKVYMYVCLKHAFNVLINSHYA